MEKLKDHKEIKVDPTQVNVSQVWPGPSQDYGASPSLAAARLQLTPSRSQSIRTEEQHLASCAQSMWFLGQDQRPGMRKNIPLISITFPLVGGWLRGPLEHSPIHGKRDGRGKWKDGQPWWEEVLSILLPHLCTDLVWWSK